MKRSVMILSEATAWAAECSIPGKKPVSIPWPRKYAGNTDRSFHRHDRTARRPLYVVAKSPLTGGWGEANSGGHFGPYLKFAGFDGGIHRHFPQTRLFTAR